MLPMPIAADEFFERPTEELLLAGVTGTNGKTTTAYYSTRSSMQPECSRA